MTYQIISPYFVAGLVTKDEVVSRAAPVIAYMAGWTLFTVKRYCHNKGWRLTPTIGEYNG